jgi:hypothetical protein
MLCIGRMEPFQTPVLTGTLDTSLCAQCFRELPRCGQRNSLIFCGFQYVYNAETRSQPIAQPL